MTAKTFYNSVANGKEDVLQLFLDQLRKLDVDYCIIGGLAVNAYAEPVVSLDLDIVIALESKQKVLDAVKKSFAVEEFAHSTNLTSGKSDLRIQIQTDSRYQDFLKRAAKAKVMGYSLEVATLEDVLKGKIWAFEDETRRKSKRQKDLADILRLVETHPHLKAKLPPKILSLV